MFPAQDLRQALLLLCIETKENTSELCPSPSAGKSADGLGTHVLAPPPQILTMPLPLSRTLNLLHHDPNREPDPGSAPESAYPVPQPARTPASMQILAGLW